jgi:hypothetical protein
MGTQKAPGPTRSGNCGEAQENVGLGKHDDGGDDNQRQPATQEQAVVVANWPKNARELFRVALDVYRDRHVVDVRVWFVGADGTERPTRSGLTVSIRHLPKIADAIAKALAEARARGLVDGAAP